MTQQILAIQLCASYFAAAVATLVEGSPKEGNVADRCNIACTNEDSSFPTSLLQTSVEAIAFMDPQPSSHTDNPAESIRAVPVPGVPVAALSTRVGALMHGVDAGAVDQFPGSSVDACLDEVLPLLGDNSGCSNGCGDARMHQRKQQQAEYLKVVSDPHIHQVCETGFFNGVSAASWLCGNPGASVVSFDIGCPAENVKVLEAKFGKERFKCIEGDSLKTLGSFVRDPNSPHCDLMIQDGGHYDKVPFFDIYNFGVIASRKPTQKHTLLVDEVFFYRVMPSVAETPGCCYDVMTNFEKSVELGMFDTEESYCYNYECAYPGECPAGLTQEVEKLPIKKQGSGGKTLKDLFPLGGYCVMQFDEDYLLQVQKDFGDGMYTADTHMNLSTASM